MSSQRKLYLFAAIIFTLGAIGSIVAASWNSLIVFVVLAAMMYWVAFRIDGLIARAAAAQAERDAQERYPHDPRD